MYAYGSGLARHDPQKHHAIELSPERDLQREISRERSPERDPQRDIPKETPPERSLSGDEIPNLGQDPTVNGSQAEESKT